MNMIAKTRQAGSVTIVDISGRVILGEECASLGKLILELGLRTPQQDCAQNPNEISAFDPKLELRDVPGKFTQGSRQA